MLCKVSCAGGINTPVSKFYFYSYGWQTKNKYSSTEFYLEGPAKGAIAEINEWS